MNSSAQSDLQPLTNWYALRSKPRAEKKLAERLTDKGFTTYLPLSTTIKVWSDRKKKVHTPLISSFVFVKTSKELLFETQHIQGTAGVLRYLGKPAIVREQEIENLKILMNDAEQVESLEGVTFEKGDEVEVMRGPFAGLLAHAMQVKGQYRIVVNVESLGSTLSVNVPMSFVQKRSRI